MKLGLSLVGINDTLDNLKQMNIVIGTDFNAQLIDAGIKLKNKAKEILEGKTNPKYSTGKLKDSIEMNITEQTGSWSGIKSIAISVGPDMRVAPYAEWIEIGHYMVAGDISPSKIKSDISKGTFKWWEGHHYMEGAWLEISPNLPKQISDTLKVGMNKFARSAKRTRHNITGRFVAGWGGYN